MCTNDPSEKRSNRYTHESHNREQPIKSAGIHTSREYDNHSHQRQPYGDIGRIYSPNDGICHYQKENSNNIPDCNLPLIAKLKIPRARPK
jgi:hypothetical protein